MERRVDYMKYFIRLIGAVSILAAMALLVCLPIVRIEGVKSKDLRSVYAMVEEASAVEEKWLLSVVENSNPDEKYDLEDHDLPNTVLEIKAWFDNVDGIIKDLFDKDISLREVFVLAWNIPGTVKDAENLMNTEYILDGAINCLVANDPVTFYGETLHENMEIAEEYFDVIRLWGFAAIGIIVLLGLLVLDAMVGNLRNKVRWGKYVLLLITLAVAVGGYKSLPMLSAVLREAFAEVDMLKNIELRMTLTPVPACILLIVPMILDRWNKKREKEVTLKEKREEKPVTVKENRQPVTVADRGSEKPEKPAITVVNGPVLRRKIREELENYVDKQRSEIVSQRNIASNERFLSTTVRGGLIAAAAENACMERSRKADGRADELQRRIAWHEQMLEKYHRA